MLPVFAQFPLKNAASASTLTSSLNLPAVQDYIKYNQVLHQNTIFPYQNASNRNSIARAILSFRFRSIEFSKKRALPFFLARELLTNRKCVASLSRSNVQAWKIRKGRLVGCKVTLRADTLFNFLDTAAFTFSRREKFQPSRHRLSKFFKKFNNNKQLTIQQIDSQIKAKRSGASYALSVGELVLFYPIELGLGLHPDVQRLVLNFRFTSISVEERFFLLRYTKIPVIA